MTAKNQPEIWALSVDNSHVLTFLDEVGAMASVLVHLPLERILTGRVAIAQSLDRPPLPRSANELSTLSYTTYHLPRAY